jgi:hypothetical protein
MANYYETARTNYFRVKDEERFRAWAAGIPSIQVIESKDKKQFAILFDEECGVPSYRLVGEEDVDLDFMGELAEHLADDEVAILTAVGSEKFRYVQGWAEAINAKGKRVYVAIDDIYQKAAKLTKKPKDITRAEY